MSKTVITLHRTENVNRLFADLRDCQPLTPEQEREALARYAQGDESAKDEIIKSNLLFVVECAKKWNNADKFTDFLAEGAIALTTAFEKFDATKGVRFYTYARQAIMQAMSEFALSDRMVKNTNAKAIGMKVGGIQDKFFAENGRFATEDEMVDIFAEQGTIVKDKRDVVLASASSISEGVGEDGETAEESGEFAVRSATYNEYEDTIESEERSAQCRRFMQCLTAKEYQVISLAFGLENGTELDDESIADRMALTKERVRQIRTGAIAKMHKVATRKTATA